MSSKFLAIATCRVSSIEQLESNSLNRQEASVKSAAQYLGVDIPSDGLWAGSVSSKSGSNYSRKDLNEMLEYCKRNPRVKYLIVDEIDRFMRSIDEMFYFEVLFREKVGVKVWYAEDPDLNSDDPFTKLRRAMEAFKAEGSNLERQKKSINGQTAALKDGRYPFSPKPGYIKGRQTAIQELHPERGPALQKALKSIAAGARTPTRALIELNESVYTRTRAPLKMDKFRKYATDPYYAGITDVNKQVKYRNEFAQHEPLITIDEHKRILEIFSNKPKNQSGPRKNGNPKYPASNMFSHEVCLDSTDRGRYVGLDLTNGKPNSKLYEKYRCRTCRKSLPKLYIHEQVGEAFAKYELPPDNRKRIAKALDIVWKQYEEESEHEISRLCAQVKSLRAAKDDHIDAIANPDNNAIRDDLLDAIAKKKLEIVRIDEKIAELQKQKDDDKQEFVNFALGFIDNVGKHFLDSTVSIENRARCKQMLFPAGILINRKNKVYTPEISEFYRVATMKKDAEASDNSHLVRAMRL